RRGSGTSVQEPGTPGRRAYSCGVRARRFRARPSASVPPERAVRRFLVSRSLREALLELLAQTVLLLLLLRLDLAEEVAVELLAERRVERVRSRRCPLDHDRLPVDHAEAHEHLRAE